MKLTVLLAFVATFLLLTEGGHAEQKRCSCSGPVWKQCKDCKKRAMEFLDARGIPDCTIENNPFCKRGLQSQGMHVKFLDARGIPDCTIENNPFCKRGLQSEGMRVRKRCACTGPYGYLCPDCRKR